MTAQERGRWRICFWILFFLVPFYAVVLACFHRDILASLPAWLQPFAELSSQPFVPLCLGAAGAGFCLAKLWFSRARIADLLAYALLISFVVMAIYGGLFLAAGTVRALLAKPIVESPRL